jgi:hypothetical protein
MTGLWARALNAERRALNLEADAKVARNEALKAVEDLKAARDLEAKARAAAEAGDARLAELLTNQAKDLTTQSGGRQVLTPGEAKEIERLRAVAAASDVQQKKLQEQYNDASGRLAASTAEASRLREANATITRERDTLREQLKGAPDPGAASKEIASLKEQLKTASDERDGLKRSLADAQSRITSGIDAAPIKGTYRDIYERAITQKNRRQWAEAARLFEAAAKLRGDTGEPIAMQAQGTEPYLPNVQLGIVRRQLACDAWDRADKDGAIKQQKDYQALAEQFKSCQGR